MKQMISLMLALLALASLTACGVETPAPTRPAPTAAPTEPVTDAPTAQPTLDPTELPVETFPADAVPLVDDAHCAFTVLGVSQSAYAGMELRVLCENRTDAPAVFAWDAVSVCGYMYDPMWSLTVPAGETLTGTVAIDTFTLEQCGVTSADEISFRLSVFDAENWMDALYVYDTFTVYPTGLSAETVTYPVRPLLPGETTILDGSSGLIFRLGPSDEDGAGDYVLPCYVENNTDKTVMFSWDAVEVDGLVVTPAWSVTVAPGKRAVSEIAIPGGELADAGIETVEKIVFTLIVSDYDDFSDGYLVDSIFTYRP